RGEYDQGQHDEPRDVLAVHSAGMLIRRETLERLGGFDPELPIFGNDIDLGWRAAMADLRTVVVPQAVVFHAEAAHRGLRRTPRRGRRRHYAERRAALYTLLVNTPPRSLPWQWIRLLLGSVTRILGLLAIRSPGQAIDEFGALVSVYARPVTILRARRRRARLRDGSEGRAANLLAPWWVPYRHGLDFLADVASAVTQQAQDVAERRRLAKADARSAAEVSAGAHTRQGAGAGRRGQVLGDADSTDEETIPEVEAGVLGRFLTSPVTLGVAAVLAMVAWALRGAFGSTLSDGAGALSPVPETGGQWWRLYLDGWHPIAQGSDVATPVYVIMLAVLEALTPGGTGAVVSGLFLAAVPVALWGAWRFFRVVGRLLSEDGAPLPVLGAGSIAYALTCVTSGAWSSGRIGIVVAAAALPWMAHAALGFAEPDAQRRWRAGWRSGLWLTIIAMWCPVAWLFFLALTLVIIGLATALAPGAVMMASAWGPPAIALVVPLLVLSPWWIGLVIEGHAAGLLLEASRLPVPELRGIDLGVGRIGPVPAAPAWLGAATATLAGLALIPGRTRPAVLMCWVAAAVVVLVTVALSYTRLSLPIVRSVPGIGLAAIVVSGIAITAIVIAATSLLRQPLGAWRGWLALGSLAAAGLVPSIALGWVLSSATQQIAADPDPEIPAYMTQNATAASERGVLVIRGTVGGGLDYVVRRGDGLTLGEDEIAALTAPDPAMTALVRELASSPGPESVEALARTGIEYVVLTAPADSAVASGLDATAGITPVSSEDRKTRAWQLDQAPEKRAVAGSDPRYRSMLLAGQVASLLVVLVMCGPTRRQTRPELAEVVSDGDR
ncbi:MAG: glycosyltransferase family 2 protein, partial [Nocardioides sp.]